MINLISEIQDFIFGADDQQIEQKYTYSVNTSYPVGYDEYGYAVLSTFEGNVDSNNSHMQIEWSDITEFDLEYVGENHYWDKKGDNWFDSGPKLNWEGIHKSDKKLIQNITITPFDKDYVLDMVVYQMLDTPAKNIILETSSGENSELKTSVGNPEKLEVLRDTFRFSDASITSIRGGREVLYIFRDENDNEVFNLDILNYSAL